MKNSEVRRKESILMAQEVNLAGEFIYAGLEKINSMRSFDEPTESFFVLYHIAVGIERLQKALIVLLEDVQVENAQEFLDSIKVHNHRELAARIKEKNKIDFSKEQNAFLNTLADFYEHHRYDKYNFFDYDLEKLNLLSDYLKSNYKSYDSCYSELGERYLVNDDVKEFIGRVVGKIGQKYYNAIKDICYERGVFSYELRVDSAAYKIFMTNDSKNSYQKELSKEEDAVKELLIFLMNSNCDNAFFRFMKGITPLDFDPAFAEEYVLNLCKKRVLTDLVDEIDYQYYETDTLSKQELQTRKEMLSAIANDNVKFWLADDEDEGVDDDL